MVAYLALLVLAAGCSQEIEPGRTTVEAPLVHGLGLQKVQPATLRRGESYVGTVESPDRGVLRARIDGQVAEMPIREGERVTSGQLLLVLDDHQAADRLKEAREAAAAAESSLSAARAGSRLAQKTHERYARLMANQAVTPQEMDEVAARLERARQQVKSAEAGLARSRAAASAARRAVSWTRIKAPYDALVVRRDVEIGSTVMPGAPLLTLDRRGGWQLRAVVPESRIDLFRVGQQVSVTVPSRRLELTGSVRDIVPATDPQSRSFEVKLGLPDDPSLAAGLFARVHAAAPRVQTLMVPAAALVERGQLHGLYVVADGRLHFRLVRPGRHSDGQVEILSGLEAGETIVVEGIGRAKDGARVED